MFFPLNTAGGVKGSGDLLVSAPGGSMSVNVATGEVIVPNSTSNGGMYYGLATSTTNVTIPAADPSNPRIDTICATVDDKYEGASLDDWKLQDITGTPTAGATLSNLNGKGTIPNTGGASSILLGYVLVPAGAANIVSGDLLDARSSAQGFRQGIPLVAPAVGVPVMSCNFQSSSDAPSYLSSTVAQMVSILGFDGSAAGIVTLVVLVASP